VIIAPPPPRTIEASPPPPLTCGLTMPSDAFVRCLYGTVLGRTASDTESAAWASILAARPDVAGARAVARGLFDSGEHLDQPGTPSSHVTLFYRALLGREPDPAGNAGWTAFLLTRYDTLAWGFVWSPEFRTHQLSTAPSTLVERLYRVALGRAPSAEDLDAATTYLRTTGDHLGLGISVLDSGEYLAIPRTLEDHLTILYRALLDRDPEPEGLAAWRAYMVAQHGLIVDAFVASAEFQRRFRTLAP
jgi:hypothetical protein